MSGLCPEYLYWNAFGTCGPKVSLEGPSTVQIWVPNTIRILPLGPKAPVFGYLDP